MFSYFEWTPFLIGIAVGGLLLLFFKPIKEVFYRGTEQTVWKINVTAFETNLSKYPRWSLDV